jgi:Trk K+ transport system NAD-binding subunit
MKFISDKDALEKLHGKILIGFLLIQDFVAIFILTIVSSIASGNPNTGNVFLITLLKGLAIMAILVPLSYFILPKLNNFISKSQEFLFLFSIVWGLGLSVLFSYVGFSIEVGALIAGVLLSLTPYKYEISSKMKPLRDFFVISFFIILGSKVIFTNITSFILPIVIFTLLIVIGNPLITILLMGLKGFSRRTSFMTGLNVAQIGEFSLIFVAFGVKMGYISGEILSSIVLVSLFTIFICTYLVMYSDRIYNLFSNVLKIFERKSLREKEVPSKEYKYILLGYNRIGFSIVRAFSKITKDFLIVDYDPKVIKDLKKMGFASIYGDVDDIEFLENLSINKSSVIVSTIPDIDTNKLILDFVKMNNSKAITILTARQIDDALDLYKYGANYVILPHFLGGEYTSKLIEESKDNPNKYLKERDKEIKLLKERLKSGHRHPRTDR